MTMLQNPKYDNLGSNSPETPETVRACTMSSMLAHVSNKNNMPDVLQKFGEELRKILLAPLDWEYVNPHNKEVNKYSTLFRQLSVDYGPDIPLSKAAERAGLKMEFPWKTTMSLNEDYLSLGYGYGAPYVYHYPLTGDLWLTTTLYGDDMKKIIALVESGHLELDLSAPAPCTP